MPQTWSIRGSLAVIAGLLVTSTVTASSPYEPQQPLGGGNHGSKSPFDEEFKQFALKTLDKWHVPGVSVAVVDGHNIYTEVGLHFHTFDKRTPAVCFAV
jgi:hypothetical protein